MEAETDILAQDGGQPGERTRYGPGDCPNTQAIIDSTVCVMISPDLAESDIDDARRAISKVWRHRPGDLFGPKGEKAS